MKTSKIRYFVFGLIAVILAAFVALSLTGCPEPKPEPEPEHYHDWGKWTVTKAATCTTEGVQTRVCRDDASHIDTQSISISMDWNAHKWGGGWTFTEPSRYGYVYGTEICAYNDNHKNTTTVSYSYGYFSYTYGYGALSIAIIYYHSGGAAEIPSTIEGKPVTVIADGAFKDRGLTSVIIPNSVTTIWEYAFYDNELTSVTIPNSVTTIGKGAFYDNELTSVTFGNSVKTIGDYAFAWNKLTSVTIPDSVTTIGNYAFWENPLTEITIGSNVADAVIGAISGSLRDVYNANGKATGTYVLSNDNWAKQ